MRRVCLAAAAAAVALAGCGPSAASSPSTSGAVKTGIAPVATASAETPTTVPTVAPGTTLEPKPFAAQLRGAMASAISYEQTATTVDSNGQAPESSVHTIVNQADLNAVRVRAASNSGADHTIMIMVGMTQYVSVNGGKYTKSTMPAGAPAPYAVVAMDIEQGATQVRYVGPESVDQIDARHYSATLTVVNGSQSSPMPSIGPGQPTYDLWIDGQGRLLKVASVFGTVTITTVYSNYDKAPLVNEPDPSEVQG